MEKLRLIGGICTLAAIAMWVFADNVIYETPKIIPAALLFLTGLIFFSLNYVINKPEFEKYTKYGAWLMFFVGMTMISFLLVKVSELLNYKYTWVFGISTLIFLFLSAGLVLKNRVFSKKSEEITETPVGLPLDWKPAKVIILWLVFFFALYFVISLLIFPLLLRYVSNLSTVEWPMQITAIISAIIAAIAAYFIEIRRKSIAK